MVCMICKKFRSWCFYPQLPAPILFAVNNNRKGEKIEILKKNNENLERFGRAEKIDACK